MSISKRAGSHRERPKVRGRPSLFGDLGPRRARRPNGRTASLARFPTGLGGDRSPPRGRLVEKVRRYVARHRWRSKTVPSTCLGPAPSTIVRERRRIDSRAVTRSGRTGRSSQNRGPARRPGPPRVRRKARPRYPGSGSLPMRRARARPNGDKGSEHRPRPPTERQSSNGASDIAGAARKQDRADGQTDGRPDARPRSSRPLHHSMAAKNAEREPGSAAADAPQVRFRSSLQQRADDRAVSSTSLTKHRLKESSAWVRFPPASVGRKDEHPGQERVQGLGPGPGRRSSGRRRLRPRGRGGSLPHDAPLLSTMIIGLVLACGLGLLASLARLAPIVGYLLAGVVVGPTRPAESPTRGCRWNPPNSA